MEIKDVRNANWGCLIKNPQVIFRITLVNNNNTIEYKLKNDEKRYGAYFSEIKLLDEKDVPDDIKYSDN